MPLESGKSNVADAKKDAADCSLMDAIVSKCDEFGKRADADELDDRVSVYAVTANAPKHPKTTIKVYAASPEEASGKGRTRLEREWKSDAVSILSVRESW